MNYIFSNMNYPLIILGIICFCLPSCSAYQRVAAPLPDTFLEGADLTSTIETLPFDQAWVRADFDGHHYRKLFLKPVRTDLLPEDSWMKSASFLIASQSDYERESRAIADYFYTELLRRIQEYPDNRIEIVNAGGPKILVAEIALTELEFSHPVARAGALAVPVPGSSAALSTISDPHAAFALRLNDSSGNLAATVADRKFPPTRIVDLNKLTVSSSIREVCSIWAGIIAEALNKGRFSATTEPSNFSLIPW